MSLLESMATDCTMLDRRTVSDGVFGFTETYVNGAAFRATIIKATSTEAMIAEKQGVGEIYTVVTAKGAALGYHDVFRRESDKQIFRVTSIQRDSEAPEASTVQIGKVSAERWVLPS